MDRALYTFTSVKLRIDSWCLGLINLSMVVERLKVRFLPLLCIYTDSADRKVGGVFYLLRRLTHGSARIRSHLRGLNAGGYSAEEKKTSLQWCFP